MPALGVTRCVLICRRFLEIVEPGNICQKMVEALSRGLSCLKVSKVLYILSFQVTAIKILVLSIV